MSSTDQPKPGLDTVALHGGQNVDPATKARAVPIYQTTSYVFDDTGHAARLFALEEFGNIYTRIMNPTTDVLEQRITALEGGAGALGVASGQAAVVYSVLNIARAGDHIVSSGSLYGGTYNAFFHTLPKFGITTTFVDPNDIAAWKAAVKPNTKAFFAETIGNPKVDVLDVKAVADAAHASGVPLIVDNTLATPILLRPIEYGADIVVHSATKFIGGHGTSIGGLVVDGGKFDWSNGKFPELVEPDPSYHGAKYSAFGPLAYILKMRVQLLRDIGAALSPFNACSCCKEWKRSVCASNATARTPRASQNTSRSTTGSPPCAIRACAKIRPTIAPGNICRTAPARSLRSNCRTRARSSINSNCSRSWRTSAIRSRS